MQEVAGTAGNGPGLSIPCSQLLSTKRLAAALGLPWLRAGLAGLWISFPAIDAHRAGLGLSPGAARDTRRCSRCPQGVEARGPSRRQVPPADPGFQGGASNCMARRSTAPQPGVEPQRQPFPWFQSWREMSSNRDAGVVLWRPIPQYCSLKSTHVGVSKALIIPRSTDRVPAAANARIAAVPGVYVAACARLIAVFHPHTLCTVPTCMSRKFDGRLVEMTSA
jgi:hypothetical protein